MSQVIQVLLILTFYLFVVDLQDEEAHAFWDSFQGGETLSASVLVEMKKE